MNTRSQTQALVSVGSRRLVFEEMVKGRVGLGDRRTGDGRQGVVIEVFDAPRYPPLRDHLEHGRRHEHRVRAIVLGDDDGGLQRRVLVAPDILLKLGGRDFHGLSTGSWKVFWPEP